MKHDPTTASGLTEAQLEKIKAAVYLSGGPLKVARAVGYKTSESIRRFTSGLKPVPAERVDAFIEATGGRLEHADVRPDLFGHLGGKPPMRAGKDAGAQASL